MALSRGLSRVFSREFNRTACAGVTLVASALLFGGRSACDDSDAGVHARAIARHAYDFDWDAGRDAFSTAKEAGAVSNKYASRFVVLMRHGQYVTRDKDDKTRILTPLGRRQVEASASYLLQRLRAHPFTAPCSSSSTTSDVADPQDAALVSQRAAAGVPDTVERIELVTSPLTRAMETSSIVLQSRLGQLCSNRDSIPIMDGLREDRPVPHHLRLAKSSQPKPNPRHKAIEETFHHLFRRPSVDQARHTVTVVSGHANVIRYFVTRALQVDPSSWIGLQLPHASITIARIMKDGRVFLYCVGDSSGMAEQGIVTYK